MSNRNRLKYIKSLQLKKYRQEEQSFCVEGIKSVLEVIKSSFTIELIAGTADFFDQYQSNIENNVEQLILGAKDLSKISSFKSNSTVLAILKMPKNEEILVENDWAIALDSINDPGNLGTILRIADWYGIKKIICSEDTVDMYNPKTIASSVGSFTRVRVYYTDLEKYLQTQKVSVFGAFLQGENIHKLSFKAEGILLMGSESHGISDSLAPYVNKKITIPSSGSAESLNVAIATAVVLDNIIRTLNQ